MAWFYNFRINNGLVKKKIEFTSEELVWPNVFIILFLSFYLYSRVATVVLGLSSECPKSSDFQCPIAIEHEQSESCNFSTFDLSLSNVRFCGNSRSRATLGRGMLREKNKFPRFLAVLVTCILKVTIFFCSLIVVNKYWLYLVAVEDKN